MTPLQSPVKSDAAKRRRTAGNASALPVFIERSGEEFFQAGRRIVDWLDRFARTLRAPQTSDLDLVYSSGFTGSPLGLTRPLPSLERDGIAEFHFYSDSSSIGKKQAMDEWPAYKASLLPRGHHRRGLRQ